TWLVTGSFVKRSLAAHTGRVNPAEHGFSQNKITKKVVLEVGDVNHMFQQRQWRADARYFERFFLSCTASRKR
ncbi:MAG: hypothetical protein O7G88_00345, partial [bacterium]|nr:hypothetical protein [bacterium]